MISKWVQVTGLGALVAIAIAAIIVATASVVPHRLGAPPPTGRYEVTTDGGLVLRLDTATGEMTLYRVLAGTGYTTEQIFNMRQSLQLVRVGEGNIFDTLLKYRRQDEE
jgi:hypothetical protein